MYKKVCAACGKEFEAIGNRAKFCYECRARGSWSKLHRVAKMGGWEALEKEEEKLLEKEEEKLLDPVQLSSVYGQRVKRVMGQVRGWERVKGCIILQRVAILTAMAMEIQEREENGGYYDMDGLIADYANMLEVSAQEKDISDSIVFKSEEYLREHAPKVLANYHKKKKRGGSRYSDKWEEK